MKFSRAVLVLMLVLMLAPSGVVMAQQPAAAPAPAAAGPVTPPPATPTPAASTPVPATPAPATADDGRKVLLYPDGTWRLAVTAPPASAAEGTFSKPADATTFLQAKKGPFGVWLNLDKWSQDAPGNPPDPNKISLTNKRGDAYASIISERIAVPMDSLKNIALENARAVAPDIRVVEDEKRIVNGKEVRRMKMEGTVQGIAFTFLGYYYGGQEGTLQVVAYTGGNLFSEYKADFDDLLNGTKIGP